MEALLETTTLPLEGLSNKPPLHEEILDGEEDLQEQSVDFAAVSLCCITSFWYKFLCPSTKGRKKVYEKLIHEIFLKAIMSLQAQKTGPRESKNLTAQYRTEESETLIEKNKNWRYSNTSES